MYCGLYGKVAFSDFWIFLYIKSVTNFLNRKNRTLCLWKNIGKDTGKKKHTQWMKIHVSTRVQFAAVDVVVFKIISAFLIVTYF